MRAPAELHFSLDEFAARLAALRERMVAAGIDVLLVTTPENIYYLSGYQTPGYYFYLALVVPVDRDPILIPPPHEESLVDALSIFPTYRLYRDTNDWIALTRDVLVELGLARGRVGVENGSWFLTSRDYLRLTAMMGEAQFVDGSGLIEQGRMTKSPRELEYMRAAARAAQAGVRAGLGAIQAGATEADVAIAIHGGQLAAGSEYPAMPSFITSGLRSLQVHATWSPKRLAAGEVVFVEVPGVIHRYHAALTRAAWLGSAPPDRLLRAVEVGQDALARAKSAIRAGRPASEAFEAARERIDSANIGYRQGRRVGYAMGTAFPPGWDEGHIISLNRNESRPLQPGMVFHVITTMRLAGLGAIGMSDTVLVTAEGAETLTAEIPPGLTLR